MKIYNKKSFVEGILMLVLGSLNLLMDFINNTIEIKGTILTFALYFLGSLLIIRSLSLKLTIEDNLDKMDERNQLIELKSKSKAFRLTQGISFLLMLVFLTMGKLSSYNGFIPMGIGLAFSLSISMFAEILTFMYYESKN